MLMSIRCRPKQRRWGRGKEAEAQADAEKEQRKKKKKNVVKKKETTRRHAPRASNFESGWSDPRTPAKVQSAAARPAGNECHSFCIIRGNGIADCRTHRLCEERGWDGWCRVEVPLEVCGGFAAAAVETLIVGDNAG